MDYQAFIEQCIDNGNIISMISVENVIRTGVALGLRKDTHVLDLCCGYGTMLKIWGEAFGITGVGVDRCGEFIQEGMQRLIASNVATVTLKEADVLEYTDDHKYEVVCCTETFGDSIGETLAILEKFLKPSGKLVYSHVFSEVPNPPKELVDFDGPMPTLNELYGSFRSLGYYPTHFVTSSSEAWESYICWEAQRTFERLRLNKDDKRTAEWFEKWNHMYFNYRRPYEGQALFILERL